MDSINSSSGYRFSYGIQMLRPKGWTEIIFQVENR